MKNKETVEQMTRPEYWQLSDLVHYLRYEQTIQTLHFDRYGCKQTVTEFANSLTA